MADKQMKSVPIIVKADVQGSVEALASSLKKIEVEGVRVDIIHTGVGAINESDITLAQASSAIVIGFNVRPTAQAAAQAKQQEIEVNTYSVIYKAIEDVEEAMNGKLEPIFKEEILGNVEARELFHYSKIGTIIGAMVMDGSISRDSQVRVIRDGIVKFDGKVASLRREKDDVKEVKKGYEFGFTIEGYNDVQVNDVIEVYHMVEVKRNSK
jgi:translation initiation factor IF-2